MDHVDRVSAAKDIKSDSSSFNALISAKLPKAQHMHTSALINVVCRHDIFLKTCGARYGYALYMLFYVCGLYVTGTLRPHAAGSGSVVWSYDIACQFSRFWPMCLVPTGLPLS